MKLRMWLFGVTTRRNIVGKIRRFGISWGWDLKISRNVVPFLEYYAARFIKSEDGTERISRNVVYLLQYYTLSFSSSRRMGPKAIPKYLSYNIRPRLFHQVWGWTRQISRNVVYFLQYYTVSVSSSLRMESTDIPKRHIFPTILGRVCFINSEDGTERYHETSYLSHNITPRLFHQVWEWNRKDIPKRRIFPTISGCVITQNVTTTPIYFFMARFRGVARWRSGWGTTLQTGRSRVRFLMVSLEFFSDIILPVALWSWGRLSL